MSEAEEVLPNVLCEFLEAVVHQVLQLREVYNPELFDRRRLFGISVCKCRHPGLTNYIHEAVVSLKEPLNKGTLNKVVVVIFSCTKTPLERYTIQLKVQAARELTAGEVQEAEAAFRSILLKLQYIDVSLRPLPKGATFEIVAYCSDRDSMAQQMWAEDVAPADSSTINKAELLPVKAAAMSGLCQCQMYVEHIQP